MPSPKGLPFRTRNDKASVYSSKVAFSEKCRHLAEECEQNAGRAGFEEYREELQLVARIWRELAEEREQKPRSVKAA